MDLIETLYLRMQFTPSGCPLMYEGWAGCVSWAFKKQVYRDEFEDDTEIELPASVTELDAEAPVLTEDELDTLTTFCEWASDNIWGEVE